MCVLPAALVAEIDIAFHEDTQRWDLSNAVLEARFELSASGVFRAAGMRNRVSGQSWESAASSSPVSLRTNSFTFDDASTYRLLRQWQEQNDRGGRRLSILLEQTGGAGEVLLEFDLHENLPVLRYGARYRNTTGKEVQVLEAEPVHWEFSAGGQTFRQLRVEQWLPTLGANPGAFDRVLSNLDPTGRVSTTAGGANTRYCTWTALYDDTRRGLAVGWEFDGRMNLDIRHWAADDRLRLESRIPELNHPVAPGDEFQVPRAFLVLFHGGPDDAGYATQRFVEAALARPVPSADKFPYVVWDSWAYGEDIDEEKLRRNAAAAALMGAELFVVDMGWARSIGDWRPDPVKFPAGLRGISDYVHSLGMKFGVHFAWPHAAPESPVLRDNPDWAASTPDLFHRAPSLCLAHGPVREWIVAEALRIIDDYGVDWILQDGQNMVKQCRKTTHTHHPLDSNYANAVDGLDWIVDRIQTLRPAVEWENCENGGSMMTYQMVRNYVTSIVNDASGARAARTAVYGATYPFPARYSDRYMPEETMDSYTTRSYLFGGPWILMNRLADMQRTDLEYLSQEIQRFKQIRAAVRDGKILHLTNPPGENRIDAMAAYDPAADSIIAVVTRDGAAAATYPLRIGEFDAERSYTVTFADDSRVLTMTGAQLARTGVTVRLPSQKMAEVVYITPIPGLGGAN